MTDAAYIEKEIAKKSPKSLKGEIRALKSIIKNELNPEVVRLASHMLKYMEQRELDERFQQWVGKQAKTLGKKPHQLTRDEVKLARQRFLQNEKSSK